MTRSSSSAILGMYNLPELQTFNEVYWNGIRQECSDLGMNPPLSLSGDELVSYEAGQDGTLFFGQTCGWPLTFNQQAFTVVATPVYDCRGCEENQYRSVIIISNDQLPTFDHTVEYFRGKRIAMNSRTSCSGCLLIAASLGRNIMQTTTTLYTGAHVLSVAAVSDGRAHFAAIDCVTFALLQAHRPQLLSNIAVVGFTLPCFSLPYVTSRQVTDDFLCQIQSALCKVIRHPSDVAVTDALAQLKIKDISIADSSQAAMDAYVQRIMTLQRYASSDHANIDLGVVDCYANDPLPNPSLVRSSVAADNVPIDDKEARDYLSKQLSDDATYAASLIAHVLSVVLSQPITDNSSTSTEQRQYSEWRYLPDQQRMARTIFPDGITAAREYLSHTCFSSDAPCHFVCFLGTRKMVYDGEERDHEVVSDCWATDAALCAQLNGDIVLGYVTAEVVPGGDWGNVVLFKRGRSAEDFKSQSSSTAHVHATRDISPHYYSQVRIHRGCVPLSSVDAETNTYVVGDVSWQRTLFAVYHNPVDQQLQEEEKDGVSVVPNFVKFRGIIHW